VNVRSPETRKKIIEYPRKLGKALERDKRTRGPEDEKEERRERLQTRGEIRTGISSPTAPSLISGRGNNGKGVIKEGKSAVRVFRNPLETDKRKKTGSKLDLKKRKGRKQRLRGGPPLSN